MDSRTEPSQYPVLMQLILNSDQIVDECREPDGFPAPSYGRLTVEEYALQTKHVFSIAETAVTEAYVLPYESASFGPVVSHPSKRCGWRSSALIRNNLSGVEWVYLRGSGGSLSLGLFEGSETVQNLEFKLNLPTSLNLSLENLYQSGNITQTCSLPLSKELYAKNTGDVPRRVRKIEISGTECRLDGFSVHACKGFSLHPGESSKLLISYRPDFSAVMVQRDLELSLGNGILVVPMKANLPSHMFALCKKSMFWTRLKKLSYLVLLAGVMMLILFFYMPLSISLPSQDYVKSQKSIPIVTRVGKTCNKKFITMFSASFNDKSTVVSVGEQEPVVPSGQGVTAKQGQLWNIRNKLNHLLNQHKGTANQSSLQQVIKAS